MKIYLTGALFNTAERNFNRQLTKLLRDKGHKVWQQRTVTPKQILRDVKARCSRQNPAWLPYSNSDSMFMSCMPRTGWAPIQSDKKSLRSRVAVEDCVLAAFLVINHELQRDAGIARPARLSWCSAVADHVARIGYRHRTASVTAIVNNLDAKYGQ